MNQRERERESKIVLLKIYILPKYDDSFDSNNNKKESSSQKPVLFFDVDYEIETFLHLKQTNNRKKELKDFLVQIFNKAKIEILTIFVFRFLFSLFFFTF